MPPCSPPSDPFNLFSITGLCWFSFFLILRPLTSHRRRFPRLLSLIPRLWCLVHLCVLHLFSSPVCLIWPRLFRSDLCLTSDISLLFPSSSVDFPPSLPLSSSLYRLVFFSPLLPLLLLLLRSSSRLINDVQETGSFYNTDTTLLSSPRFTSLLLFHFVNIFYPSPPTQKKPLSCLLPLLAKKGEERMVTAVLLGLNKS